VPEGLNLGEIKVAGEKDEEPEGDYVEEKTTKEGQHIRKEVH
jgi:hypothetical protein